MKSLRALISIAICAAVVLSTAAPVLAVSGIPGSPDFGIGAAVTSTDSIATWEKVSQSGVSWVKVEISWASFAPSSSQSPDFSSLAKKINTQFNKSSSLLISIQNPPSWAMTGSGPSIKKAIALIDALLASIPQVSAIELFPEANTTSGWGTIPSAFEYIKLLQAVQKHLNQIHSPVLVIAGGLKAVNAPHRDAVNDLDFLQQMYDAGAASEMPVLSLHLDEITAEPGDKPGTNSANYLRHYEEIRQVMIKNQHSIGLIWVTSLHFQPVDPLQVKANRLSVSQWTKIAISQMKSQLYLGMVILPDLQMLDESKNL